MVRLGTSVGEAIAAVVERYGREGRSPRPPQRPSSSITPTSSSKAPPLPDEPVEISIGILSSGNHFAERMGVRKTWMSAIQKSPNVIARFFVALYGRKEVDVELKKVANFLGDIVFVPFLDNYDLVVLKTCNMRVWAENLVSQVRVLC